MFGKEAKSLLLGIIGSLTAEVGERRNDYLYPRFPSYVVSGRQPYVTNVDLNTGTFRVEDIPRWVSMRVGSNLWALSFDEGRKLLLQQFNLLAKMCRLLFHSTQSPESGECCRESYKHECPVWPERGIPRWWPAGRLFGGAVCLFGGMIMVVQSGYRRIGWGLAGSALFAVGWLLLLAPTCW